MVAARKKTYSLEERSEKSKQIIEKLTDTFEYKNAQTVLCYWSMPDEVFTHDFVVAAAQNKRIFLPVVDGDILRIREFRGVEDLSQGSSFSILEPGESAPEGGIEQIDLVVVPGVAFDLQGGRLGRGKGFYDKLLSDAHVYKIGICFDFQLIDQVPRDAFDILMDKVLFG